MRNPHEGGSYTRDPKTGELTRNEFTRRADEPAGDGAAPQAVAAAASETIPDEETAQ